MLTNEQIRNALWDSFHNLTEKEVEQLWIQMLNFWSMMLERTDEEAE